MKVIRMDGTEHTVKLKKPLGIIRVTRAEYEETMARYKADLAHAMRSRPHDHSDIEAARHRLANYQMTGNAYIEPDTVTIEIIEG